MANEWTHDKYDDALEAIKLSAKVKMVLNYHKGDIANCSPEDIIAMLRSEVDELERAVFNKETIDVIEEAGDVHNFLVALVHQRIEMYRSRK